MMKKILLALILLCAAFLVSCKTIEGVPIAAEQKFGRLWVTSSVDSANIFLDRKDTGKITPALLENIPVGKHVVQVFRSQYFSIPDSALVEVAENRLDSLFFALQVVQIAGDLQVSTTPDSALVIVDNLPRGYSPLTVSGLSEGAHSVKLLKASHLAEEFPVDIIRDSLVQVDVNLTLTRSVLVEHFSNSGCDPCVPADLIIEEILIEKGIVKTVSLGYHLSFPAPTDPMYLAARIGNEARRTYYGIQVLPTVKIDGVENLSGNILETELRNKIDGRANLPPGAILEIFDFQASPNSITGRVRIQALENLDNTVLHVALIEREIIYTQQPSTPWNGQLRFFDVFRDFYPSKDGTPVTLSPGQRQFISFNIPYNALWVLDQLEVVVFLQRSSKEVVQAAWTMYP